MKGFIRANRRVLTKCLLVTIIVITGLTFITAGFLSVSSWFDYNKVIPPHFKVNVDAAMPKVVARPIVEPIVQITFDYPVTVDTPIKEYVCEKFDAHCKEALAIVQCESGWKEDALGINDPSVGYNYRADGGLFQINSVHWEENGGLTKILDPYHNVDVAYELFKQSGWSPWYAHGTPCFQENLK